MQGILFNEPTGMLSAVKEGIKTVTRRTGGLQKVNLKPYKWHNPEALLNITTGKTDFIFASIVGADLVICRPRFEINEIIYVKESYQILHGCIFYKVDYSDSLKVKEMNWGQWSNPMFFGKIDKKTGIKIARTYLRVLDIKCERLHEITRSQCIKEGIQILQEDKAGILYKDYSGKLLALKSPIESFATLVNKVNKKDIWKNNPWVFAYSFEIVTE